MLNQLKLRGRIVACTLTPLVLCTILAGLIFSKVRTVDQLNYQIEFSENLVDMLGEATLSAIRMERSMRGYLVNGKARHRQGFELGRESYDNVIRALETQIKTLPNLEQQQRFREYVRLGNKLEQIEQQMIELTDAGKTEEAVRLFSTDESSNLIRDLQEIYTEFIDRERQHLAAKHVENHAALSFLSLLAGWGTAIVSLVTILMALQIATKVRQRIYGAVSELATSSREIAAVCEQQEKASIQQASSVNQTTTAMDELGTSSKATAKQAEAAATSARQVLSLVDSSSGNRAAMVMSGTGSDWPNFYGSPQEGHHTQLSFEANGNGGGAIAQENYTEAFISDRPRSLVVNHSSLKEKVGQIADRILYLSQHLRQIDEIARAVSAIAAQTNMLALNASVEAVRAGEAGKGFGIVASEIRKLADQSRRSAERINILVEDIQSATSDTVSVTQEGTKTVDRVVEGINEIVANTQQISLTAQQQAIAIQQVFEAMNTLNQVAGETAWGITQAKVGTEKLNAAAINLKEMV